MKNLMCSISINKIFFPISKRIIGTIILMINRQGYRCFYIPKERIVCFHLEICETNNHKNKVRQTAVIEDYIQENNKQIRQVYDS